MNNITFYDASGNPIAQPGNHVAFLDHTTGLTWGSQLLDIKGSWAQCLAAAEESNLCGARGWSAPSLQQQVARMDYGRFGPALDPVLFPSMPASGWLWTSSRDAGHPQDCAWYVFLSYGDAGRDGQDNQGRVLVVRSAPLPRQ